MVETIAIAIAKTGPFESRSSKCPDFEGFRILGSPLLNNRTSFDHNPDCKLNQSFTSFQRMSKCLSKSPYLTFCWNQCKETCGMCGQIFSTSATLHKHVRYVAN